MKPILLCSLFLCCKLYSQPQKLYLNPKATLGEKQSKFIDSLRFIPLETPKGIVINSYSYLFTTKKYFAIYEYSLKRLSLFNKSGRFEKKFNLKKYGDVALDYDYESDLLTFNVKNKNYSLTDKDMIAIKSDYNAPKNKKYFKKYVIICKDSLFKIQRIAPTPYDILGATKYYDNYYYLSDIVIDERYTDTLDFELKILSNNKTVQSFFPYNKREDKRYKFTTRYRKPKIYLNATDTPYIKLAARPYNTIIYKLNRDSIYPLYEIVLPMENSLPTSFFTTGFKTKSDRENFESNNGWLLNTIFGIQDYKNYLIFGISYFTNYEGYIYDKRTHQFYNTNKIKADSTQYNLQLMGLGLRQPMKGKFYTICKAEELLNFYNANKEKNIVYPNALIEFFKTATKKSNPVVVEYILKN